MFRTPVAGELFGDLLPGFAATPIAKLGQRIGIALAANNCADDRHARQPRDVGNGSMNANIHLIQVLLHPPNPVRAFIDHRAAFADQRPEPANVVRRPKGATEQPAGVQQLNPLAVEDVGLSTRYVADLPGIGQHHLKAAAVENLEQRDPVYAGAFHCHGFNALLLEPVGQTV